jgi:hypothetical protein
MNKSKFIDNYKSDSFVIYGGIYLKEGDGDVVVGGEPK